MSPVPSTSGPLGADSPPPPAQLLCRLGPGAPLRYRLTGTQVLGSDPGAGVPLLVPGVSRQHLRLSWEKESWWVEDLGSSNGTFLNGRLVARDRLRHLDVVSVGRAVEILFLLRQDAPRLLRSRGISHAALVAERGGQAVHAVPLGETTVGRSSSCSIVVEPTAVSKVHARLERTAQQLTIRDLSSANGTYVNGQPVTVASLRDGDVVSLAGVSTFRVVVEEGEVVTDPRMKIPVLPPEAPAFSMEWKTRYDWDEEERQQLEAVRRELRERDELKKAARKPEGDAKAPKPSEGATTPVKVVVRPKPSEEAKPKAPAPVAEEEAPATLLPGAVQAAPPPRGAIRRVVLVGETMEMAASEPGAHDIGRGSDAALRPDHPTVSRRHARLTILADRTRATIEDIGGRAGTARNGVPVVGPVELQDGDVLRFGEAAFKVRIEA
jgi:pSer/pThr/pTyr-binding forkhead associated (FHA) protein